MPSRGDDDHSEVPPFHDAFMRRFFAITDIRHTEGGHWLSHDMLMILVLFTSEEWELLPCDRRFLLRVLTPGFRVK
jgi:hypothetical protein